MEPNMGKGNGCRELWRGDGGHRLGESAESELD
jgi:hypothetical protein